MSKIKMDGLDQCGAERFGRFICTMRKSVRLKGLTGVDRPDRLTRRLPVPSGQDSLLTAHSLASIIIAV